MSKVSHLLPTCWVFRASRVGCLCIVPTYTSGHSAWRGYEEVSLKLLQIHTHSPSEPPRARGPKRKKPPTLTIHYELWSTLRTVRSSLRQTLQSGKLYNKVRQTTNSTKRQTLQSDKLYQTTNSTQRQTLQNDKLYQTTNSTKRQTLQNDKLNKAVNSKKRQTLKNDKLYKAANSTTKRGKRAESSRAGERRRDHFRSRGRPW